MSRRSRKAAEPTSTSAPDPAPEPKPEPKSGESRPAPQARKGDPDADSSLAAVPPDDDNEDPNAKAVKFAKSFGDAGDDDVPPDDESDTDDKAARDGKKEGDDGDNGEDDGFPADLLSRAEDAGMSVEEAKAYGSSDALGRTLDFFDRSVARKGREVIESAAGGNGGRDRTEPKPSPAGTERKTAFPEALDEVYEKPLLDGLRKLEKQQWDFQDRMGTHDSRAEAEAERAHTELETWFDDKIADLGEDWHDVLGKGAKKELSPHSTALRRRRELLDEMHAMEVGCHATGRRVPSDDALFAGALRSLHHDKIKSIAVKEGTEKIVSRGKQAMNRPTPRRSNKQAKTGEENALAFTHKMRTKGGADEEE